MTQNRMAKTFVLYLSSRGSYLYDYLTLNMPKVSWKHDGATVYETLNLTLPKSSLKTKQYHITVWSLLKHLTKTLVYIYSQIFWFPIQSLLLFAVYIGYFELNGLPLQITSLIQLLRVFYLICKTFILLFLEILMMYVLVICNLKLYSKIVLCIADNCAFI